MKKFLMAFAMWFVRLTWGILDTLIGLVIFLVFLPRKVRIGYVANTIVMQVKQKPGEGGWGVSGGLFIVSNTDGIWTRDYLLFHEWGHTWPQLLALGPLHPFLVSIPSIIRFYWRDRMTRAGKGADLPTYDSAWFEGTATVWGTKWFIWGAQHKLWA